MSRDNIETFQKLSRRKYNNHISGWPIFLKVGHIFITHKSSVYKEIKVILIPVKCRTNERTSAGYKLKKKF